MKNKFPLPDKVSKEEIELYEKIDSFYIKFQQLYKDWTDFYVSYMSNFQDSLTNDFIINSSENYELSVQMDKSHNKLISCQISNSNPHEQKN